MERGTAGRAVLHGVLDQIATVKFVLMTHFMADVVGVLGLLSLALQKEDVTYQAAKSQIDAAIVTIQSMLTQPGPYMREIQTIIPRDFDESEYVMYQGHDIKDKRKHRKQFKDASEAFVDQVLTRLSTTFPDNNIMANFQPLCPKDCTDSCQLKRALLKSRLSATNMSRLLTKKLLWSNGLCWQL